MPLSKEQIQQAKPQTRQVEVPELAEVGDGKVLLGVMPALKLYEFMRRVRQEKDQTDELDLSYICDFLAACVLDPDSLEPAFTPEEFQEAAATLLSMETLKGLFNAAYDLHGISDRAVEDLEKNSDTTPGDSSGGASPGSEATPTPTGSSPS